MKLTTTSTRTIGLFIDWLVSDYQADIVRGVAKVAADQGANLFVFLGGMLHDEYGSDANNAVFRLADPSVIDGVVLGASNISHDVGVQAATRFFQTLEFPMCSLGIDLAWCPSVLIDNRAGFQMICEHALNEHGYREFAMIGGRRGNIEAEQRRQSCIDLLAEHGVELPERRISDQDFVQEAGAAGISELLDERGVALGELDMIVCANDALAAGAVDELKRRGFSVPEDVAITGFDDIAVARHINPPLTTVHQPVVAMGRQAARTLFSMLAGESPSERRCVMPSEFVVRRSCGCLGQYARHAVRHGNKQARLSFEAQLIRDREVIAATLARAAKGAFGAVSSGWEQRLLLALNDDLSHPERRSFVGKLDAMTRRLIDQAQDIGAAHDVLTALRAEVVSRLDDPASLATAEDIFHEARELVSTVIERSQALARLRVGTQSLLLHDIVAQLLASIGHVEFFETLRAQLPRVGVKACFIARFEDESQQLCRLIYGFDESSVYVSLAEPVVYRANQLVPPGVLGRDESYAFVVTILHFRGRHLGLLAVRMSGQDAAVYEALRGLIGTALGLGTPAPGVS